MQSSILERLQTGGRKSLARAITIVENNLVGQEEILKAICDKIGNAHVIGVTGPPGVGKSTLIDACIPEIRKLGRTVAVLAVDPSSHVSGGAILGDRVRMARHGHDEGVFIRSVAARGHLGGLTTTALNIINLFDATDWNAIIVETVGTGQSEVEISQLADTVVVVESPGRGDEIQAIKAGLLEIADIVVVNKSDMPEADSTMSDLSQAIALRHAAKSPLLLKTIASGGEGVSELIDRVVRMGDDLKSVDRLESKIGRMRKLVARNVGEALEQAIASSDDEAISQLIGRVLAGEVNADRIARDIMTYVSRNPDFPMSE
ncbi:MAG: methylmalonyl Co-A mutase-associated GTPase MeaB [Acidiferrobacterales bacterium]|nr:methylmalonyl Co-A mutase-associated GTPase MeaB [Acidiferrobacterales bacterium]